MSAVDGSGFVIMKSDSVISIILFLWNFRGYYFRRRRPYVARRYRFSPGYFFRRKRREHVRFFCHNYY